MPNNPIPDEKRETIVELSKKGTPIYRIAKLTGTCRPTVRKYAQINESLENTDS